MSGNSSKIIAFNYFGGKFTYLDDLYDHMPTSGIVNLVDLFGGSFVVALNYGGKIIRTANEINGETTNFFWVLREFEDRLIRLLEMTPCSELEYKRCWEKSFDPIERARRFYVRVRQSYKGFGGHRKNKKWHMALFTANSNGGETVSKWRNGVEKLHEVAREIRDNFQITNMDYADCIDKFDDEEVFYYCDPPYSERSRKSKNDYLFEFTDEDHYRLGEKLSKIKGRAMVSGYNCSLMREIYGGWRMVEFEKKRNGRRDKDQEAECIWMNYEKEDTINLFNYVQ